MRAGSPIDMVLCVGFALAKDLPDVEYDYWPPSKKEEMRAHVGGEKRKRRPMMDELEVYSFPQTWGSTALGFGGIGGQAMTDAQTTVVMAAGPVAAVYFSTRLAYVISGSDVDWMTFMNDVRAASMAARREIHKYLKGEVKK